MRKGIKGTGGVSCQEKAKHAFRLVMFGAGYNISALFIYFSRINKYGRNGSNKNEKTQNLKEKIVIRRKKEKKISPEMIYSGL